MWWPWPELWVSAGTQVSGSGLGVKGASATPGCGKSLAPQCWQETWGHWTASLVMGGRGRAGKEEKINFWAWDPDTFWGDWSVLQMLEAVTSLNTSSSTSHPPGGPSSRQRLEEPLGTLTSPVPTYQSCPTPSQIQLREPCTPRASGLSDFLPWSGWKKSCHEDLRRGSRHSFPSSTTSFRNVLLRAGNVA